MTNKADKALLSEELIDTLVQDSKFYSYFQLVYLLESYGSEIDFVGGQESEQIPFRFRSSAHLAFPASDIESLERDPNAADQLLLTLNFMGLYGPASPLPTFYTEEILTAEIEQGQSLRREFLDLFHHRLFYLLYRVWKKYRYYILYEQGAKDPFSQWMFSLIGLGEPLKKLRESGHVQWERLLSYVGLLSMRSRSAALLENILSHSFYNIPVKIEQCIERWVTIEADQQNGLGENNCTLGKDLTVGERVLDRAGKFLIQLGPLDFDRQNRDSDEKQATFQDFLETGRYHDTVRELVKFFLVDQLDFDIKLVLKQSEMPYSLPAPNTSEKLYLKLSESSPCQLGWSTWLGYYDEGDGIVIFQGRE